MLTLMAVLFFAILAGILSNTIIVRYSTLRSVRIIALLVIFLGSLPLVVLALINLAGEAVDPAIKTWSLGVLGVVLGFWLKNPLRGASD